MLHGQRALVGEKLAAQRAKKKEQVPFRSLLLPASLLLLCPNGVPYWQNLPRTS